MDFDPFDEEARFQVHCAAPAEALTIVDFDEFDEDAPFLVLHNTELHGPVQEIEAAAPEAEAAPDAAAAPRADSSDDDDDDWRDGGLLAALEDEEPPQGVCTALQRDGATVAAANSDSNSPLRTWDLATGALVDRFALPSFCRGVRCLQLHRHELVAGCGNGWVVACDLRSGRFERKLALPEMVNTLEWRDHMLLTGGDDGVVRLHDAGTFTAIGAHRAGRCVFAARFDSTRIYAGCDNGEVRIFDYSSRADAAHAAVKGGFTPQQKQALFNAFMERPKTAARHSLRG